MPRVSKPTAAQTFDSIMEHAERRGRVVLEVEVDGVRVKLAPPQPPKRDETPLPSESAPSSEAHASPLDDPASYGLPPGAAVPGFRRPQPEEP